MRSSYYRNTVRSFVQIYFFFSFLLTCQPVFQSIGCWADSPEDRAMATLEGKHTQLKHQDYKTRVNSLMKCAEAADENNLKLFALQNGGQCFGGSNNENTYYKYGRSSQCEGENIDMSSNT